MCDRIALNLGARKRDQVTLPRALRRIDTRQDGGTVPKKPIECAGAPGIKDG